MPTGSNSTALTAPGSPSASTGSGDPPAPPSPAPKPQLLGQGLALEAVSQAAAMAVQDAGTYFRQVASVSAAAIAVFTAKMVETQSPDPWSKLIQAANTAVTDAAGVITTVSGNAAGAVKSFTPS